MTPAPRWLLFLAWVSATLALAGVLPLTVPHIDWINHCWMLNRVAAGWLKDGVPPLVLNGTGTYGEPWFLFYGLGVYVPLAPLAWLLGAPVAIKLGAVAVLALLGWRVAELVWRGTGSATAAACVTVLVLSAVFPISDLGARGAVPEFFACQGLAIALVCLVLGWLPGPRRAHYLVQACCLATLAAFAHPPMLFLASLFLAPVVVALLWALGRPGLSRRQAAATALALLLCVGTAVPYLLAVVPSLPFLGLQISTHKPMLIYFSHSIDHPLARLFPIPLDLRSRELRAAWPRLSAPLHGALAVVVLGAWFAAVWLRRSAARSNTVAVLALAALGVALAFSLPVWTIDSIRVPWGVFAARDSWPSRLVAPAQFGYRLVAVQDLLLILLVCLIFVPVAGRQALGSWLAESRRGRRLLLASTAVGVLGMAGENVMLLGSGAGAEQPRSLAEVDRPEWPRGFYARTAFATPGLFPRLESELTTSAATREGRDSLHRHAAVRCRTPCNVVTDVVPTRFSRVSVDGRALPQSELRSSGPAAPQDASGDELRKVARTRRLAFALPAGQHRVQITLLPAWTRTYPLGIVAVSLTALLAQLACVWPRRRAWLSTDHGGRREPAAFRHPC